MSCLKSADNAYGGTYVSPEDLPTTKGDFAAQLNDSILIWQNHGVKVVWLKLPNSRAELFPIVYKSGFENHHCGPDFVMLTLKLQAHATIPPFATHTIGVGGLVINDNNELLTIREKGQVKTHPHNWKFPGGMLDPYEHFEQGVMREVMEETGIKTKFSHLIGFRHHHQGQFTTSNIYAVCRLHPLTFDITIQESEIADARWFPVEDYLNDKKIGQYNQQIVRSALKFPGLKSIDLPGYMSSSDEYEVFMS